MHIKQYYTLKTDVSVDFSSVKQRAGGLFKIKIGFCSLVVQGTDLCNIGFLPKLLKFLVNRVWVDVLIMLMLYNIVMKIPNYKQNSPDQGGFSDLRIRFFVLSCLTLVLLLTPFFGLVWSSVVTTMFAYFIAVKRSAFEQTDPKCIYTHGQAMDKMYHNGVNAKAYERLLQPYEDNRENTQVAKIDDDAEPGKYAPSLRPVFNS